MEYYIQINTSPISYRSYTGQSQETITSLLNTEGHSSFSFIEKTVFDEAVALIQTQAKQP